MLQSLAIRAPHSILPSIKLWLLLVGGAAWGFYVLKASGTTQALYSAYISFWGHAGA